MPFPMPRVPPVMMAIGLELEGGGGEDEDDIVDGTIIAKESTKKKNCGRRHSVAAAIAKMSSWSKKRTLQFRSLMVRTWANKFLSPTH